MELKSMCVLEETKQQQKKKVIIINTKFQINNSCHIRVFYFYVIILLL